MEEICIGYYRYYVLQKDGVGSNLINTLVKEEVIILLDYTLLNLTRG